MNHHSQSRLATLKQDYHRSLPDKIAALEALWDRYWRTPEDRDLLESISEACHRLAGSGGTFGFTQLSERAREMEMLVLDYLSASQRIPTIPAQEIHHLISSIHLASEK